MNAAAPLPLLHFFPAYITSTFASKGVLDVKTCHGHYPLDKGLGDLTRLGSQKRLSCTQCMPDRLLSMPPPPTPLMGRPPSEPAGLGWASPVDRATIHSGLK